MPSTTLSRKHIDPDTWYSSAEAAEILSTHLRTIQRERLRGRLRGARINSRGDLRFCGSWLLAWLEARAVHEPEPRDEVA